MLNEISIYQPGGLSQIIDAPFGINFEIGTEKGSIKFNVRIEDGDIRVNKIEFDGSTNKLTITANSANCIYIN